MLVTRQEAPIPCELRPAVSIQVSQPPRSIARFRRSFLWSAVDDWAGAWVEKHFARAADSFSPEVVLSVLLPDWFLTAAARYAERRRLPLALFCHDDYADHAPIARKRLAGIYRQAAARLCVSKPMEQEFFARYAVHGDVLPPISGGFLRPIATQMDGAPLILGFAGSIGFGYEVAIVAVLDLLMSFGGRLAILSPTDRSLMPSIWNHPALIDLGVAEPERVCDKLMAAGVNALLLVQSFDPKDSTAFRLNFPSKLSEYATYGLPLLIVAPEDASAVVWARERPGAALVVTAPETDLIKQKLVELNITSRRRELASGLRIWVDEFAPDRLNKKFSSVLTRVVSEAATEARK